MSQEAAEFLRDQVQKLRVWKREDVRATHKPLLMLYALHRCVATGQRLIPFLEVERDLKLLLEEFAAPREKAEPYLPFWHLRSDELWEVPGHESLKRRKGKDRPLVTEFREHNPHGGFPKEIFETLMSTPRLADDLIRQILFRYFPFTQYEEILQAIGLEARGELVEPPPPGREVVWETVRRQKRDSSFRVRVLAAYGERCSLCGYDLQVAGQVVGVEAAHIQWHNHKGPDVESNGLPLCSLHHRLFDKGAFTLLTDLTVRLSQRIRSSRGEWLDRFESKSISQPDDPSHRPGRKFLEWHWRHAFHGEV